MGITYPLRTPEEIALHYYKFFIRSLVYVNLKLHIV